MHFAIIAPIMLLLTAFNVLIAKVWSVYTDAWPFPIPVASLSMFIVATYVL